MSKESFKTTVIAVLVVLLVCALAESYTYKKSASIRYEKVVNRMNALDELHDLESMRAMSYNNIIFHLTDGDGKNIPECLKQDLGEINKEINEWYDQYGYKDENTNDNMVVFKTYRKVNK